MTANRVLMMSAQDRLLYFVRERESVRLRKQAGQPKPWTDDNILQRYRFCNICRMDDKVSRWLMNNWYYRDHKNMLPAVALARFINLPSSLEKIFNDVFDTRGPNWEAIKLTLQALPKPVFNSAYVVRGGKAGGNKINEVVDDYVKPLHDDPPAIDTGSMEKTWEAVYARYGFGSFMAGQVVADLRWAMVGEWADRMTWAPLGPGSKRGMNRLHDSDIGEAMTQLQFEEELADMMEVCRRNLAPYITDRLEAMDYQNILCEYDKYNRVLFGEGRPKSKYPGVL